MTNNAIATVCNTPRSPARAWLGTIVCALSMAGPITSAVADETVVRVEEDWTLVLNEPNNDVQAPQFHTLMAPGRDLGFFFFQVCWNYQELPEFQAGGMQLQSWDHEEPVSDHRVALDELSTAAETIRWTQVLETNGSVLSLEIVNGSSTSWGSFGGGDMRSEGGVHAENLNQYSTDVSVDNSLITYGSNRVDSMIITEVRRYGPNGLLSVDSTPKVVFRLEN